MVSMFNFNYFIEIILDGLMAAAVDARHNQGVELFMQDEDLKDVNFEIDIEIIESGVYDGAVDGVGMHIGEGWISNDYYDINVVGGRVL